MNFNFSNKDNETILNYKGNTIKFIKCESITSGKYKCKILSFKPNTKITINNEDVICTKLTIKYDGTFDYL